MAGRTDPSVNKRTNVAAVSSLEAGHLYSFISGRTGGGGGWMVTGPQLACSGMETMGFW
jgi:hypothetical protein